MNLGLGHTARAISAGGEHTCAILDDGTVRCWGYGGNGQLGYGSQSSAGATPATTPDKLGPVNLGLGHTAVAISAGDLHTCAILDDGTVRCWGYGANGQLGYGNINNVGDTPATTPDKLGAVNLGGHRAEAISAGGSHTCAILDDATVRCWGFAFYGQLGYGNQNNAGGTLANTPDKLGPVNLGSGHTARAISAGSAHTCAVLEDATVHCWGDGADGRLGYANTTNAGATLASPPTGWDPLTWARDEPRLRSAPGTAIRVRVLMTVTCAAGDMGVSGSWATATRATSAIPRLPARRARSVCNQAMAALSASHQALRPHPPWAPRQDPLRARQQTAQASRWCPPPPAKARLTRWSCRRGEHALCAAVWCGQHAGPGTPDTAGV